MTTRRIEGSKIAQLPRRGVVAVDGPDAVGFLNNIVSSDVPAANGSAGYVHVDPGQPDEMYVWPYFARYPVTKLTPPQLVELFRLVYAGDYEDMLDYGLYTSFRVGLAPNGTWSYFLSD
jgi:folate-binding Fe-S cluster repair protein YgfZ